ncbi:MAG: acyl--CoA ligase [Schleiferiaceae bacterium]|jgi:acyl-CoA synthetase (AMP-forming)/AMP-acid ligase II|nr:acyl--CoA ligase [Schleiferiaceae bacterium]
MVFHSPILSYLQELKPDHEICVSKGSRLLAGSLVERSLNLAQGFVNAGMKRGDVVLFAVAPGIEFLETFVALIHVRAKVALVDPHMGSQLYASKIEQLKPQWAFIDSRLLLIQNSSLFTWLYQKLAPGGLFIPKSNAYKVFKTGYKMPWVKGVNLPYNHSFTGNLADGDADDEIVIVYTSGSLAEPKGVVQSIHSIHSSLLVIGDLLKNAPGKRMVSHLPHFALIGMFVDYQVLFWDEKLSASAKLKFIEKHQIDTIFAPPSEVLELMDWCQQNGSTFPESLQHIILGSAPILNPFLKELRKFYFNKATCFYGMTENVLIATIDADLKLKLNRKEDVLGKPHGQLEYKIAKDGELFIQTDWLYKRYFHQKSRSHFHATGDLVELNEEGYLLMKGRKKNMIIRKHKNIYPGLYEPTICAIPGVKDACMLGMYNNEKHDEEVILLVDQEGDLTDIKLMSMLTSGMHAIDSDALPDKVVFGAIPRFGRQNKIDYQKLKAASY